GRTNERAQGIDLQIVIGATFAQFLESNPEIPTTTLSVVYESPTFKFNLRHCILQRSPHKPLMKSGPATSRF
ncbi:MAG: hypothetical protein ACKOGL_04495, partial [Acidimicrobiaceae bacterium]